MDRLAGAVGATIGGEEDVDRRCRLAPGDRPREAAPFAVAGLAALVYALGRASPAFGLLFDYFPGVKLITPPA